MLTVKNFSIIKNFCQIIFSYFSPDDARRDIANIIRKGGNGNSSTDEDSDDSLDIIPTIKRKQTKLPQKRKGKRKKYNVLKNIRNGK